MESFSVKVTPTTSRILQELAFASGLTWAGGENAVKTRIHDSVLNVRQYGVMTHGKYLDYCPYPLISFEEAAIRIAEHNSAPQPLSDHTIQYNSDGSIKVGCQEVAFSDLEAIYNYAKEQKQ